MNYSSISLEAVAGRLIVGFLLFVWCAIGHVFAQGNVKSGNEIPEALQQIQPAGGVCRKDDRVPSMGGNEVRGTSLDMSCAITPQDAAIVLERNGAMIADVRPTEEFQLSHVNNAMNLSESDILAKHYLREKTLLMMGSGKLEAAVYRACTRLRSAGYKQVFVVRGGIGGWLQQGYPLQGGSAGPAQIGLSVAEFWAEVQQPENVVVLDADRASMHALIPDASVVSKDAAVTIRAALEARNKGKFGKVPLNLIFVFSSSISPERIRKVRQVAGVVPVLFFSGSDAEFSAYAAQKKAVWLAQVRGPKKLGCGL